MNIVFTTKLSAQECIHRITRNAEKNTLLANLSMIVDYNKNFFYKFNGNSFRLEKVIYYRNAFKPIFFGKIIKQNNRTKIEGHFDIFWFVRIFMSVWFTFALLICGYMFITSIDQLFIPFKILPGTFTGSPIVGVIFPILFLAFSVVMVKTGKQQGKKHEKQTIEFIQKILEAKLLQ